MPHGTWVARRNGRVFITGNTFPRRLVRDPLAATSPAKVCEHCGAPWFRIVEERNEELVEAYNGVATKDYDAHLAQNPSDTKRRIIEALSKVPVREHHSPTCECEGNDGKMVARVLDPCMGSGTVGIECVEAGSYFVGVDISEDYVDDAEERILNEGYGVKNRLKGTPYEEQLIPGL